MMIGMAEISVYHNPNCSSSRTALDMAEAAGVEVDVVLYLKTRPDAEELRSVVEKLDGPVTELVRRDALFAQLGLTDEDVASPDQVVAVLAEHPKLIQRPVLIGRDRAVVGRPKERIAEFLGS